MYPPVDTSCLCMYGWSTVGGIQECQRSQENSRVGGSCEGVKGQWISSSQQEEHEEAPGAFLKFAE